MGLLKEIYSPPKYQIVVGDKPITVEILRTQEEQTKGFQGRECPGPNEGLLFLYSEPRILGFWMKDVPFPLQLLAFDENNCLVQVLNLRPYDETIRILNRPCATVLELPEYWCQKNNVVPGAHLNMATCPAERKKL